MNTTQNSRCGFVALLGAPNAGKSTLLNAVVGQKIAIVTPKAQTTRSRMLGIALHGDAQLIFIDVPGIFKAKRNFEKAMVETAWSAVAEADVVLWMHDCLKKPWEETEEMITRLAASKKPVALVLNKVDALENKQELFTLVEWFAERLKPVQNFMISARYNDGVQDVLNYAASHMQAGPWLYPEDQLTDAPSRFIAAELTREQCFMKLREELPYALHVETEKYDVKPDGSVAIHQIIVVENERQKMMVLGKGGQMLKAIGSKARESISRELGCTAHVFLFVKVREDWKSDANVRNELGLKTS